MRAEVAADFDWQRQFVPAMKGICGRHLIDEAPFEEDAKHNTDLIVLTVDELRVACRARRWKYRNDYGDGFTIRSYRPNGYRTELAKVIEDGWGDYLLYGFGHDNPPFSPRFVAWTLARLDVFRAYVARQPGVIHPNRWVPNDDGTEFVPFCWSWFPPEFVIATSRTAQRPLLAG